MRMAIAGAPRTGKTTLVSKLKGNITHTDDLIEHGWSEASEKASYWFDDHNIDVIEGVAVPRALRKWLHRNLDNTLKPIDMVIYLKQPFVVKLTPGQQRMAKGNLTVWNEIKPLLVSRGVIIKEL